MAERYACEFDDETGLSVRKNGQRMSMKEITESLNRTAELEAVLHDIRRIALYPPKNQFVIDIIEGAMPELADD